MPANYPLEIIQPRPGLTTASRFYRQYPGVEYNVKLGVIGGVYGEPAAFTYELTVAPSGMTIDSTGRITWANPTTVNSPHTVTARVTDSDGTLVSVTWTVTVTTSQFIFCDAINGSDSNAGTIGSPFQTINGWYKSFETNATYSGYHVYYRAGTYTMNGHIINNDMRLRDGNKPLVHLGYPGEVAVFNFAAADLVIFAGTNDICFDDLEFINVDDNPRSKGVQIDSASARSTFRRIHAHDLTALGPAGFNASCVFHASMSSYHTFATLQDCTFRKLDGPGHCWLAYTVEKGLAEGNLFDQCGKSTATGDDLHGTSPKASCRRFEVRNNRATDIGKRARMIWFFGQIDINPDNDNEIRFNSIRFTDLTGESKAWESNRAAPTSQLLHHIYRNTFYGRVEFSEVSTVDGPYQLHNNIIINTLGNWECRNCTDSSRVVDTNNLKGVPADNIVDANNELMPAYQQWLGLRGHQLAAGGTPPNAPTGLRIV